MDKVAHAERRHNLLHAHSYVQAQTKPLLLVVCITVQSLVLADTMCLPVMLHVDCLSNSGWDHKSTGCVHGSQCGHALCRFALYA